MRVNKLFLVGVALSSNLFAQDIKIVGTIDKTLVSPVKNSITGKPYTQPIKLLNIKLSDSAYEVLSNRAYSALNNANTGDNISTNGKKVQLGMNNVPVLNQGAFGSCVTFASTAAIDAILGKGDYVSQLCQLQLGSYLEANGYNPSGWNGSFGNIVLAQMDSYGIINKKQQQSKGCGGLKEYPTTSSAVENTKMSAEEYHSMSQSLQDQNIYWTSLVDVYSAMLDKTDTNKTLDDVKKALNEKHRVTFGTLLIDLDSGFMGAMGTHKASLDTWVLTPEIADHIQNSENAGGHEMVITGYDDDAVAVDEQGRKHTGLLTLRNSWGPKFGDKGDFYMSYDYFKTLVLEAYRIRHYNS